MARPFRSRYSQHTATFPLFEPWERRNRSNDLEPIDTEDFTVPGSDNGYSVELDHGILQPVDFTVYDATADQELQVIGYDEAPSASQVAVKYDHGLLKFHSSCEDHDIEVLYTPLGTVQTASFANQLQKEIAAIIDYVYPGAAVGSGVDVREYFIPGVIATTGVILAQGLITGEGIKRIRRISLFANDISTLSTNPVHETVLRITAGGTQSDISLPVTGAGDATQWHTETLDIGDFDVNLMGGPVPLTIECVTATGGHGNMTVEITIQ
jgi:hypothetical protein